jgi:hypothetical protein
MAIEILRQLYNIIIISVIENFKGSRLQTTYLANNSPQRNESMLPISEKALTGSLYNRRL